MALSVVAFTLLTITPATSSSPRCHYVVTPTPTHRHGRAFPSFVESNKQRDGRKRRNDYGNGARHFLAGMGCEVRIDCMAFHSAMTGTFG